jgi:hypothetical protein
MSFFRDILAAFFVGFIVGGFSAVFLIHATPHKTQPEKTIVKLISGAPLSAVDYCDKTGVHIAADYDGAGASEITVPLSRIPEAAAWIEKRRTVSLLVSPRGALYAVGSYRWDCFSFSGGFRVPAVSPLAFRNYDLLAGIGWTF